MGILKFKTSVLGLALVGSVSWLFAQAVVDQTFDDNQNDFEYYWYYYDDNSGVGPNDRPAIAPDLKPTVVDVPFTERERHAFDDANDKWKVKQYTFTTGESFTKKCAVMPFTFGDPWEADYCSKKACAMPYVGIGTMLCAEGKAIDLTGVTAIKFSIKSRVNTLLEVRVKMETLDINTYSNKPGDQMMGDEFGYFGKTFAVEPGDWQEVIVGIDELTLPGTWAKKFTFDIKQCTKLAWEIKGDGVITGDTVDIADVSFEGTYKFVSPSMWDKAETAPPTAGFFSDFDQAPFNQGPPKLNYYWYAYNDVEIGGTSTVSATYATPRDDGRLNIEFVAGTGANGAGRGAALEYTLGKSVMKDDTIPILGFVGLGINLYDSATATYWDAATAGANSVYFEYATDGDAKMVTFELSDLSDVGDKDNPTRKDSRGSGIVHYRNFPPTNGEWRKVLIPFDSLVEHTDWQGYKAIPLDKTKLAKAQWKVQGSQGLQGIYSIDNIYFPSADFGAKPIAVIAPSAKRAGAMSFSAAYAGGNLRVRYDASRKLAGGRVTLVNTRGAVVASASAASGDANLSAALLPAGMYFVRLNGVDAAGKAVVGQARVTIVK